MNGEPKGQATGRGGLEWGEAIPGTLIERATKCLLVIVGALENRRRLTSWHGGEIFVFLELKVLQLVCTNIQSKNINVLFSLQIGIMLLCFIM